MTASRNQRSCATRITRGVDRREQLLEPLDRLDVEVVRRLVEEQQVGLRGERARQRGPRQLAARERRERPVEVGVGEAEPAHDRRRRGRASRSRPRARAAPAPTRSCDSVLRSWSPAAIARLELAQLLLERRRGRPCRRARTRAAAARSSPAGAGRAARPARPSPRRARRPRATPRPSSARSSVVLPAPFGPGEREPVAALDLERDAVEERACRRAPCGAWMRSGLPRPYSRRAAVDRAERGMIRA